MTDAVTPPLAKADAASYVEISVRDEIAALNAWAKNTLPEQYPIPATSHICGAWLASARRIRSAALQPPPQDESFQRGHIEGVREMGNIIEKRLCEATGRDYPPQFPVTIMSMIDELATPQPSDVAGKLVAVLGEMADKRFILRWIAAPRPPVHPTSMNGDQDFATAEDAITFMIHQPSDATFLSLTEMTRYQIDRTADCRAALAEARASGVGGEG